MTPGEIGRRVLSLLRRRQVDADLDEEIRGHLDAIQEAYEDEGLPHEEARRRARLRLGGTLQTREASTDAWRWGLLEAWGRDLRLGARALRRQPVFSLAAVATFALGIGAATAIFSIAYGIALKPLPYPAADRLVRVYEANTVTNAWKLNVSQGSFQAWRETVPSLALLARVTRISSRYTAGSAPQSIAIRGVSPAFFDVVGVAPSRGRGFKPESEYGRGKTVELIASFEGWQRLFGAADFAERDLPLRDQRGDSPRIVGIMPRGFEYGGYVDFWRADDVEVPVARVVRPWRYDDVVARLKPGATIEQVRVELDRASARLATDFPASNAGWIATVEPLKDAIVGKFGGASWLLLAAVAGVLLVASANVAGLLTARALGRTRETSIRVALGAGRARLAQLWLSETLVLAVAGAAIGVGFAWWFAAVLRKAAPPGVPRVEEIAINWPVLTVAAVATGLTAVIAALVPLFSIRNRQLPEGLGAGASRTGDHPRRRRASAMLVGVQCAGALALVVVSVVFARSFLRITAVDLGWQPEYGLGTYVSPRMPIDVRRPWFLYVQWSDRLVARLEATPGIARAAITTVVPFQPELLPGEIAAGREKVPDEVRRPIGLNIVSDHYFDTIGLTLTRGRLFTQDDRFGEAVLTSDGTIPRPPGVAVVTESVARTLWPGQDPIGQSFRETGVDFLPYREVVGVVADVRFSSVTDETSMQVFFPWSQSPTGVPRLVVRTTGDPAAMASAVRAAILAEDADSAIDRVVSMNTSIRRATAPARLTSQMVASLGALALVLAAIGVYGSLSTLVRARSREIAVRMALGASAGHTLWRTIAQGLTPVVIGAVAGTGLAAIAVSSVRSLLFGIDTVDTASLASGSVIVLTVTILACLAPALRAARTNPLDALRGD